MFCFWVICMHVIPLLAMVEKELKNSFGVVLQSLWELFNCEKILFPFVWFEFCQGLPVLNNHLRLLDVAVYRSSSIFWYCRFSQIVILFRMYVRYHVLYHWMHIQLSVWKTNFLVYDLYWEAFHLVLRFVIIQVALNF